MVQLSKRIDETAYSIFSATLGAVFFGVPTRGMEMDDALALVGDLPVSVTLRFLDRRGAFGFRKEAHQEFLDACKLPGSGIRRIVQFFEEHQSRGLVRDEASGRLVRRGSLKLLVSPESAVVNDIWKDQGSLPGDHSSMIKLQQGDLQNYRRVKDAIQEVLSNLGAGNALGTRPASNTLGIRPGSRDPQTPLQLPRPIGSHFIGRERILQDMKSHCFAPSHGQIPTFVLCGRPGVGKTQIALKFVLDTCEAQVWDYLIWVRAETADSISSSYDSLGQYLGLTGPSDSPDAARRQVRTWLEKTPRWCLVYDNLDDISLADDYWPHSLTTDERFIIVTSRNDFLKAAADKSAEVECFDSEQSMELYMLHARRPDATEPEAAGKILGLCDGLPFAITVFSRQYYSRGRQPLDRFLAQHEMTANRHGRVREHHLSLDQLWESRIRSLASTERGIMDRCALLDPDGIDRKLLGPDEPRVDQAIINLAAWYLLNSGGRGQNFSLHRLVQDAVKRDWSPKDRQRAFAETSQAVADAFPPFDEKASWEESELMRCGQVAPHLLRLVDFLERHKDTLLAEERLLHTLYACGRYLWEKGRYDSAARVLTTALRSRQRMTSQPSPSQPRNDRRKSPGCFPLGWILKALPRSREKLITLHDRRLAELHFQLGLVYMDMQDKLPQAKQQLESCIRYSESLAQADPSLYRRVATAYQMCATVLSKLGRVDEAEALCAKALAIRRRPSDSGPIWLHETLYFCSLLKWRHGKLEEALEFVQEAVQMHNKQGWPGDYETKAIALHLLGNIYSSMGETRVALEKHQECLQHRTRLIGPSDGSTGVSHYKVACLHLSAGATMEGVNGLEVALRTLQTAYEEDETWWDQVARTYLKLGSTLIKERIDEAKGEQLVESGQNLLKTMRRPGIEDPENDQEIDELVDDEYL